jgi:pyruvate-formate lyase-activating enzyme
MIINYSLINFLSQPCVSIFFKGCDKEIKCTNCHNSELWEQSSEKRN